MPAAQAIVVYVDDSSARAALAALEKLGAKPPMRAVAQKMYRKVSDAMFSDTDPWGSPWPPLSPVTLAKRRARGNESTKPLIDTGAMYDSTRVESDDTSATVSMDAPEAIHQYGAVVTIDSHRVVIPPRPLFPDSNDRGPPDDWWNSVTEPFYTAIEAAGL